MKRNFVGFVLFVTAFCCLPEFGLDFMGAPCADLQQGQYSIGFNYSYSDMGIDIKGSYFGNHLGSIIELPKELEINKYYAALGYGLRQNWDVYLLLGIPRGEADVEHSGDMLITCDPILGIGTKLTFHETPRYKLGGIFQLTYASGIDIGKNVALTLGENLLYHTVKGELDMMEIQIAAGPTYMLNECISVYGGPFLHFISGDFHRKEYFTGSGLISKATDDVREASWFGGYIGTQIKLIEKMPISVEWQHTAFADAVGANIVIKF